MASKSLAFVLFIPHLIISMVIAHLLDHKHMASPFEFIKCHEGCRKGDNTKGIRDLKLYLQHFGYLNYKASGDLAHANDNGFDGLFESAVKMYQLKYHLIPTGTIDSQTAAHMMMPRCGVADIVDGMNWMGNGKKDWGRQGLGPLKWPASKSHLTYTFFPDTPEAFMAPVARAFSTWSSVTHFTFSQVSDTANSDIKIGFSHGDHGDSRPFDGRGGVLAHAFAPTRGVLHFGADEAWSVDNVPDTFNLEMVALHEIDHLLGLGHSSVPGVVMYPGIAPGTSKGLHSDDVEGIKALYNF